MRPARSTLLSGVTIFLSAFLLFWIQPLIAKRILPWFGGATAVWVTCLLFFQVLLLAGYCYAHALARWPAKVQAIVHSGALGLSLLVLPVGPSMRWKPSGNEDPVTDILLLLAAAVGLPYFLLSATTPLVSNWYARLVGAGLPYRLFALSNFASLVALIAFPSVFEPRIGVAEELRLWSGAFALFVLLCAWLAVAGALRGSGSADPGKEPRHVEAAAAPRARDWALWLALAACGSAMLLAVTNHLTQNVASIPFLWVLPLTLYLATFMIAFERERWYRPLIGLVLTSVALEGMAWGLAGIANRQAIRVGVPLYALGMFCCCFFCHGELAWRKPAKQHLTGFYLAISLGGAVGASFVSVIAPHVFASFYEFPLAMLACAALAVGVNWRTGWLRVGVATAAFGLVAWYSFDEVAKLHYSSRVMVRNFYGGLRVEDDDDGGPVRELVNGTINHGVQYMDAVRRRCPVSYYGQLTGVGWALRTKKFQHPDGIRVGVIGLGAGTLAAYGGRGDEYHFYEINPLVEGIARGWFTYLGDSEARISVTLGDGRLSIEGEPPREFDVLAVDAFSSGSIPVHLLTREAGGVYGRQLNYDGILALHISNANLDLRPVAAALAAAMGRAAWLFETDPEPDRELFGTSWVLVGGENEAARWLAAGATRLTPRPGFRPWTDDYSNLFEVLK